MWRMIPNFWKKNTDDACMRLHGKPGTCESLPQSEEELQKQYGPVIQELSKR